MSAAWLDDRVDGRGETELDGRQRGSAPVPLVDVERAGGIDLARLERGLGLQAERVGDGRYRVTGGDHDHWVDLYSHRVPRCDCGDHLWRERICKHMLAALLREGDERVVRAIGELVETLKETRAAA